MPTLRIYCSALAVVSLIAVGAAEAMVYPTNKCVSRKQNAAADFCRTSLNLRGRLAWNLSQAGFDAKMAAASAKLANLWASAEAQAAAAAVDCADTTLTAADAETLITDAADSIAGAVHSGLDLGVKSDAGCAKRLLGAAGALCRRVLRADATRINDLAKDPKGAKRDTRVDRALAAAGRIYDKQVGGGCSTTAGPFDENHAVLTEIRDAIVRDTTLSPNVDDAQFSTILPTGPIEYLGRSLEPTCLNDTPYRYFVKRGSVNKLVVYYQGGGACWEGLTCGIPVCADTATNGDNPQNATSGFADFSNPANPFRDWNIVFVTYCSCDIHFGDAEQQYTPTLLVQHRGYHNARVVEKWAREHFLDPDEVFVTGSSAGAYGAWFHGPLLHEVWPGAQFHILADAGNGVITQDFLLESFPNWNFQANLPKDVPELQEVLDSNAGIVGYTELAANYYPDTNWAHYSTAFDGGTGGQTGFYNVMLNDNNPIAALSWWEGSCQFNEQMTLQAQETAALVPSNYRYYIGTGSRHTMWGSNKVYSDTTGGVPTIVDWVNGMLASTPGAPDPAWSNVECTNCGLTLPGDPGPPVIPTPPFLQVGPDVVITCDP